MKRKAEAVGFHGARVPPDWVQAVVDRNYGESGGVIQLHYVMEKKITKSDLDPGQNRLLIPSASVRAHVIPYLQEREKIEANLDVLDFKKMKKKVVVPPPNTIREVGRDHGGLEVQLFGHRKGDGDSLAVKLVRWDTAGTVLKGGSADVSKNSYLKFMACNGFGIDDNVEMWGFRCKKEILNTELSLGWKEPLIIEKLCFVLGKKEV